MPNTNTNSHIHDMRFGIEIETIAPYGGRQAVANIIQSVVGGRAYYSGGFYDSWAVRDEQGREWKIVYDASINAGRDRQAEVVSPVLTYGEDMETVQQIARALRAHGVRTDDSCGIHIHIDPLSSIRKTVNLTKMVYRHEQAFMWALDVLPSRQNMYCRRIGEAFMMRLRTARPTTREALNRAWYGYYNANPSHYDRSRYCVFNLHNLFFRRTIEFRWFNSTLHAGRIKTYVQLVLAMAATAERKSCGQSDRRHVTADNFQTVMQRIFRRYGMVGDEFKTARRFLLNRMARS